MEVIFCTPKFELTISLQAISLQGRPCPFSKVTTFLSAHFFPRPEHRLHLGRDSDSLQNLLVFNFFQNKCVYSVLTPSLLLQVICLSMMVIWRSREIKLGGFNLAPTNARLEMKGKTHKKKSFPFHCLVL